jgi:hypothetical protein
MPIPSFSVPVDLDVKLKATLLGGAFLIDFMLFEGQNRGYGGGYTSF